MLRRPATLFLILASAAIRLPGTQTRGVSPAPAGSGEPPPVGGRAATSVRLRLPPEAGPAVDQIARIFIRKVAERSSARVSLSGRADLNIDLAVDPGLGPEAFVISDEPGPGIRIAGGGSRGLLYGVGRFLRDSTCRGREFFPGAWRGGSAPACPVRGVYLAVHGGNFYEAAPAADVERYIEDLALWGLNAVACHFPPQQFQGLDDPAARRTIEQIRRLLVAAKRLGLDAGLLEALNCGFAAAPKDLLYTPFPDDLGRRGHYGVLLCPSRPRGRAYLLDLWSGLLDAYRDVGLDFFVAWPYDEGGCGCADCRPWGAKGFPGLSRDAAGLVRSRFPASRFVLATWMYDTPPAGEWEGLSRLLEKDGGWVDALLADAHEDFPRYPLEHPAPGGKPLLNFPEISMWGQSPWGGFGANPLPARFERLWNQAADKLAGGFPYSEGIFEDINKVLCLQFYWDRKRPARDILGEYARWEFSPAAADDVARAVRILEANHRREGIGGSAEEAAGLMEKAERRLAPEVRRGWRWRILRLRADIDRELYRNRGKMRGPALARAFEELTRIYHAENASASMRPPVVPSSE